MHPTPIRSLGAGNGLEPRTDEGTMVGKAAAATAVSAVFFSRFRRVIRLAVFMRNPPQPPGQRLKRCGKCLGQTLLDSPRVPFYLSLPQESSRGKKGIGMGRWIVLTDVHYCGMRERDGSRDSKGSCALQRSLSLWRRIRPTTRGFVIKETILSSPQICFPDLGAEIDPGGGSFTLERVLHIIMIV